MNKSLEFLSAQIGKDSSYSTSPLMRWLNPTLIKAEEGSLEYVYEVREEMTNPVKILHGGATAAIIDDALGATVYSLGLPNIYSTVNLAIDYFSTAREGEKIIARTSVIKKGDKIINVSCEVWNSEETRMIAKGYSNLIKTALQH